MKRIITIIMLLGGVSLFTSCEEQQLLEYQNDPGLQFYWGNIPGKSPQKDSMNCSFFVLKEEVMWDTVWLRIETMGFPAKEDRPVKLIQLPEAEEEVMAQPNVHYLPFDSPELQSLMVVKANQVRADIPVILHKDPSLKTKEYRLSISIAPNDHFTNGITRYQTFLLKITDFAEEPESWKTWKSFFGIFGPVKLKFLITYVGVDFTTDYPIYMYQYYKTVAREKLSEYNSHPENKILAEADGTIVSFD